MAGGAILDDAEDGAAVLRGEIRRILGYALSGAATNAIHDSSVFLIVPRIPRKTDTRRAFASPYWQGQQGELAKIVSLCLLFEVSS